jgi:hypothetical protein
LTVRLAAIRRRAQPQRRKDTTVFDAATFPRPGLGSPATTLAGTAARIAAALRAAARRLVGRTYGIDAWASFGASDRELARLANALPSSVETERHDALRRLGGFRRLG